MKNLSVVLGLALGLAACGPPPAVATEQAQSRPQAQAAVGAVRPITGTDGDYDDILAAAAGSTRILLGESTHGTREYYRERARLTERLVRERGVTAVAIEGDWTPSWRVDLYVRGLGEDGTAEQALSGFTQFPRWMWANTEFRDFVERLRAINLVRPPAERVGLYGIDVYDLFDSADAVVAHLRLADPAAAARVRRHYRCFQHYDRSTARYGEATLGGRASCRSAAEAADAEVRALPRPRDLEGAERRFAAIRAAASVVAAEEYFRTAYGGTFAWNARDRRMAANVEEIAAHTAALTGRPGKVVIWSHNTHSGDARATAAVNRGEINLGQLMRERHGDAAFLVGLFSDRGTVFAAPEWDSPGRVYEMRPALPESWVALLRAEEPSNFSLLIRGNEAARRALAGERPQRAIGVVYQPSSERRSHYFAARLADQFDAIIFLEQTTALTPLRR